MIRPQPGRFQEEIGRFTAPGLCAAVNGVTFTRRHKRWDRQNLLASLLCPWGVPQRVGRPSCPLRPRHHPREAPRRGTAWAEQRRAGVSGVPVAGVRGREGVQRGRWSVRLLSLALRVSRGQQGACTDHS